MAQNTTTDIPAVTWTQVTTADITSATFQNNGGNAVWILATVGAIAPTGGAKGIRYNPGSGERSSVTLATLFPGLSGANRLYAYAPDGARVFISHA